MISMLVHAIKHVEHLFENNILTQSHLLNSKSIEMVALEFFFNIHAALLVSQSETWILVNLPTLDPV